MSLTRFRKWYFHYLFLFSIYFNFFYNVSEWAKLLKEPVQVRKGMQRVEVSLDEKRYPPCACQQHLRGSSASDKDEL
jgi:hypothetical protein